MVIVVGGAGGSEAAADGEGGGAEAKGEGEMEVELGQTKGGYCDVGKPGAVVFTNSPVTVTTTEGGKAASTCSSKF